MGDKMSIILVDAKYFGQYFRTARKMMRLNLGDCAKMLGITRRQALKIENGKLLMPERVIEKIMVNGMAMILCKKRR